MPVPPKAYRATDPDVRNRRLRRLAAELVHALDHEPALATSYTEIQKLFASRADAVAEGMARAKNEAATADKLQPQ